MLNVTQKVKFNRHKSILLIGEGATNTNRCTISYADNKRAVQVAYGNSQLASAFNQLYDLGVPYIFLLNVRDKSDYFRIGNVLRQSDFAYIVPVSILISDEFDEPNSERRISYIEYLAEQTGFFNESVFIVTDKHASLYEDIDHFLHGNNDGSEWGMNYTADLFSYKRKYSANGENIIFVANNLEDYEMANIPLAASLVLTEPNIYPQLNFGNAIFEIDAYEMITNWAYFQNHSVRDTTVENLLNFAKNGTPKKIVFISRILKYIKRELDLEDFVGKQYSEYRRIRIYERLKDYLDSKVGKLIYDYNILSVSPFRDPEPMTIDIVNQFEIWPVNCLDKCTIEKTVEVA